MFKTLKHYTVSSTHARGRCSELLGGAGGAGWGGAGQGVYLSRSKGRVSASKGDPRPGRLRRHGERRCAGENMAGCTSGRQDEGVIMVLGERGRWAARIR